ncbi:hypothetical protein QQ045_016431 [Rhodiola kirilowii]
MYEEQMRVMDETCNSFVMDAVAFVTTGDEDDVQPRRRRPNQQRQRWPRGQNLLDDYFIEHSIFLERDFRMRYQMSRNLFNRIKTTLCNHDPFWHQRHDAAGVLGLLPEQKMTDVIHMLAYRSCADQCAEITQMGVTTTLECMKECFIGVPEAQNDLNVLYQSDIFDPLLAGICPQVTYKVNGSTNSNSYYFADGIYPRYSSFVNQFPIHKLKRRNYTQLSRSVIAKMLRGALEFYDGWMIGSS